MGAAMICLAGMSSEKLYGVVSCFLARPVEQKCCSPEQEDSLRPLTKATVYLRSWVSKSVDISSSIMEMEAVTSHAHSPLITSINDSHTTHAVILVVGSMTLLQNVANGSSN